MWCHFKVSAGFCSCYSSSCIIPLCVWGHGGAGCSYPESRGWSVWEEWGSSWCFSPDFTIFSFLWLLMPTLRCCLCTHMVCYTQEEIALVFPSSLGFFFRLFCNHVLRCHLGNSKLGWRFWGKGWESGIKFSLLREVSWDTLRFHWNRGAWTRAVSVALRAFTHPHGRP